MKTDILTVVDTGYDATTGFYVNGTKKAEVHCNDEHEIPGILYVLMTRFNFVRVDTKCLSDDGFDKYDQLGCVHPESINEYGPDDFE
ncbi:hypothetical protein ABFT51_17725 [Paenibacillus peoriae]|uniref:hypothetical protein n=1 Tax=Paenibacillus peoriae TaxID=59893 RepID=UPI0032AEA5FC